MQEFGTRIYYLLNRFFRNECTELEKMELIQWIERSNNDSALMHRLEEIWKDFEPMEDMSEARAGELLSSIIHTQKAVSPAPRKSRAAISIFRAAAACVILLIGVGTYFLVRKEPASPNNTIPSALSAIPADDIAPGKAKAVLTLSDGSKIVLDTAGNAIIAKQGNSQVVNNNGQLSYDVLSEETAEVMYNTLTTQRGEQYHLTLSDGTGVWLNAVSSIRFPVAFTGNWRDVEITGEAYFEVVHNAARPFRVKADKQFIEVLGTHFNVNSYSDETELRTTLIEGSVKVSLDASTVLLRPNEQAVISNENKGIKVSLADGQAAIAWKNGLFKLNSSSVAAIMRQIARWYNVEVIYEGPVPIVTISGEVPRNLNLSEVLKVLEISGIHCRLEGHQLIIKR